LWEILTDGDGSAGASFRVVAALGFYHLCRAQVLPAGHSRDDTRKAQILLGVIAEHAPELITGELRDFVDQADSSDNEAEVLMEAGLEALEEYERTQRAEALDEAAEAFREAVAVSAPDDQGRGARLTNLGNALLERYRLTGHRADLVAAIDAMRQAVAAAPPGHPKRGTRLSNLGNCLLSSFRETGDLADLAAAIEAQQEALAASPDDDHGRGATLSNLAGTLLARFERTGDLTDLDAAVSYGNQAVAASPTGHPDRPAMLSSLGGALLRRFERIGASADLDAAIDAVEQAMAAVPRSHSSRSGFLVTLSACFDRRFDLTGDVADLNRAIDAAREAVDKIPVGHPDRPMRLANLGAMLRTRFEQTGDLADLDTAIDVGQRAVAAASRGQGARADHLANLAPSLTRRFQVTGLLADLNAAVDAAQQAADFAPPGDPHRHLRLSNLSAILTERFDRTGDRADLDAAIVTAREAVDIIPHDHPERGGRLTNLGIALLTRFRLAGDIADLDGAVDAQRQAVSVSANQLDRARYLTNLARALTARFDRWGDREDLDAAIEADQQAIAATPPKHPDLAARRHNLGIDLLNRFQQVGDVADLDAAISASREGLQALPPNHVDAVLAWSNLGNALAVRFDHFQIGADLDAAIDAGREAIRLAPPDHPQRPSLLTNLAASLVARFHRSSDSADLDAAVDIGQQAVAATPPGHSALAVRLNNLAATQRNRFDLNGSMADLDAAIDEVRRALQLMPPDHPERQAMLSNLGNCLRMRFEETRDAGDLDDALAVGRDAVDTMPEGHPDSVMNLVNFGTILYSRFSQTGDEADFEAAVGQWRQATQMTAAASTLRLLSAQTWGSEAVKAQRIGAAVEGYSAAVRLLSEAAWHGLDRATRQDQLARWGGLASDAAAAAILNGRPELAVELLEQGRSVLWTQALNMRSDLTLLADRAPDLARRLDDIRAILDKPQQAALLSAGRAADAAPAPDGARSGHGEAELRRRKAREWDEAVAQVRALAGFEHFLAPTPYAELASSAAGGPVVIVNTSRHGCHALILTSDRPSVRTVPLTRLTRAASVQQANKLLRALALANVPGQTQPDRDSHRLAVLDVLAWLWDVLVEPVLSELGYNSPPKAENGDPWPRVWWCPTGPLTMLPIHAAGHHPRDGATAPDSADCTLDRVISSYVPTLAALSRARRPLEDVPIRQVTIAMPTTPGRRHLANLPGVTAETNVLARHFPPGTAHEQLVGRQATRARALAAMNTHSWVHLACHAGQQHEDPGQSGFALWHATLTINDLTAQPTQPRDLAFLSACETAAGSVRHPDEAIHLAAAMQVLGYRHVIATLWTIADRPAPYVADFVYAALTAGGQPDSGRTGEALHHAVRRLRAAAPDDPLIWAPYVHFGG
jgi:molybdenum-dependent DNA-binding transcriptional regulator ModE